MSSLVLVVSVMTVIDCLRLYPVFLSIHIIVVLHPIPVQCLFFKLDIISGD